MRWIAVGIFVLSSTLNFLDRSLLASLAPLIEKELRIDDAQLGWLLGAFGLAYALSSPFTGYLLDRLGLNRMVAILVAFWSTVSIVTAFTTNFSGLMACRIGLGIGESGGIPAVAKMGGMYLPPKERALGSAMGQIGITIGQVLAATAGLTLALHYGWRRPFLLTGVLGLLWIPLWLAASRSIPPAPAAAGTASGVKLDSRLWLLFAANVLLMGIYSLWMNWTTIYLVRVHHLTLAQSTHYAWVPPVASNLGGFAGGWLALRWIGSGVPAITARVRVVLLSALGCLCTLAVPFAPTPAIAVFAISLSYFSNLAGSVNIYTIPIDLYGPERAGMAISALVFAVGLQQFVISPVIGKLVQTQGFAPVCWIVAIPPMIAWALVRVLEMQSSKSKEPAAAI